MKTTLLKKLFAAIIASVAIIITADAQIVYTKPDTTLSAKGPGSVYNLDINNDGIIDFIIPVTSSDVTSSNCSGKKTNRYFRVTPLDSNAVLDTGNGPRALILNEIIQNNSASWLKDSAQSFIKDAWLCGHIFGYAWLPSGSGSWYYRPDTSRNYVGLKIKVAQKTYYGWLKIKITDTSFTIQEYACNLKADQQILAGQTTTSYITTSAITQTTLCAGNTMDVGYTAYGNFNGQNLFTAEISDSLGSFNNPLSIGSLISSGSGIIVATIPKGTVYSALYRVRVKSSNPLRTAADNGGDLKIYPGLPAATIISYGGTVVCGGTELGAPSNTEYTYQWKRNNVNIAYANGWTLYTDSTGNYSCVITNVCGSITSNVISITVLSLPYAAITAAGPTSVCNGEVALSANNGSGLHYQWYVYDNYAGYYIPVSGAISSMFIAKVTGYYEVLVTDSIGCSHFSNSIAVYIITQKPRISISPRNDQTLCNGNSIQLSVSINNYSDGANYQYQWKKNGVNIPGATSYNYYASTAGTYTCKMTNECGSTTSQGVKVSIKQCTSLLSTAAISDEKIISATTQLKIAPNPFSNSTTISFTLPQSQKVSIRIYDMTGRLVKTLVNAELQQGAHQFIWDVKDKNGNAVGAGIYFLKMDAGNITGTKKLLVIN